MCNMICDNYVLTSPARPCQHTPAGEDVVEVEQGANLLVAELLEESAHRRRLPQRAHRQVSDLQLNLRRVLRDAQLEEKGPVKVRYCDPSIGIWLSDWLNKE